MVEWMDEERSQFLLICKFKGKGGGRHASHWTIGQMLASLTISAIGGVFVDALLRRIGYLCC